MKGVNLGLIASGTGTDADAIMSAWRAGNIPEIDAIKILISTKKGVGCLEKARKNNIFSLVIDYKSAANEDDFNHIVKKTLLEHEVNLVFLVGCIHKIYPIEGVDIYNIHPTKPAIHGGKGMYGLKVHISLLKSILTEVTLWGTTSKRYFTYPTVHEVITEYDAGQVLLQQTVEIPHEIVQLLLDGKDIELLAKRLQEHVLKYEWLMLPTAVRMAALRRKQKERG